MNGGSAWTNYTTVNGLGSTRVTGVAFSGSTIVAATDGGVSVSTDDGANWKNYSTISLPSRVAISGTSIYVGSSLTGGLFLSTDNGASWLTCTNGLASPQVSGIVVSDSKVYVSGYLGLSVSQ
jgi:photosystem II stability/assembly factor-like uncharacterized protein